MMVSNRVQQLRKVREYFIRTFENDLNFINYRKTNINSQKITIAFIATL